MRKQAARLARVARRLGCPILFGGGASCEKSPNSVAELCVARPLACPFGATALRSATLAIARLTSAQWRRGGCCGAALRLVETRQLRKRHPRQNAKARSTAVRQPVFRGTCASVATPRPPGSHRPPLPQSRSASRKARSVRWQTKPTALNAKRETTRNTAPSLFLRPFCNSGQNLRC